MIAHGERRRRKVSLAPAIAIAVAALALIAAGGFGLSVVRAEKRVSAGTVTRVDWRGASDGGFSNSPTIARNPARAGNIAAAVRLDGDVPSALLASSEDAGATWRQTQLPLPPAVERPYWPDLAFSPDGTLFVVYENVTGRANTPAHLWLSRSTDGGRSLSRPVQLAGPLAFEPRITAGPEGNVYVTWLQAQQVGQLSLPGAPPAIVAVHSADGGRSFSAPVPLSDTNRTRIGAATPVLTSDGTLIVLYEDFKDDVRDFLNLEGPPWPDPFALVVTRSTDEGQTFAAGQEIDSNVMASQRFVPFAPPFPSFALGANGSLAVAWADARGGFSSVLVRRSTDGGVTWSAAATVDRNSSEHRLPAASIAPDGRVDILFLDNRRAPSGPLFDAYLASSSDGARTFIETKVGAMPTDARVAHVPGPNLPPDLGSHLSLDSDGNGAIASWPQTQRDTAADAARVGVVASHVDISTPGALLRSLVAAALLAVALCGGAVAVARLRPAVVVAARQAPRRVATAAALLYWGERAPVAAKRPAATPVLGARRLRLFGRDHPIVLPKLRDPRLHVAACIMSVQVLGQVALEFNVSVAQILLCLIVCALLELMITLVQQRAVIWPASALLTGNGVALIMRVPGTEHGDWWSLHGAPVFAVAAAMSLLSKYALRFRGKHVFNPSNVGLVICFLLFGTASSDPQDLWWGPVSIGLGITYAIIVVGGLMIVRRLRMLSLVASFWLSFSAFVGVITAGGHCITARWHVGAICGLPYWWLLASSPEILIFMFFMITDPQTAAKGRVARVIYGASVAFIAALLVAPQRTEFSTKVAILAALVVVCALQPLAQRLLPSPGTGEDRLRSWIKARFAHMTPRAAVAPVRLLVPSAASLVLLTGCAGLLVAAAVPAREPSNTTTSAAASSAHIPARPAIALDPAAVPPVDVTPAVRSADSSMTDSKAREMVRDLVEDLMIESLAVQKLDANVAASAAAGSSLQTTVRAVQQARLTGRRTVAQYHLSRATLILSRDPNDYQASPQVAVQLKGTMLNVAYSGASGLQPSGQNQSALDRIFVLQKAGAHHLIVSDYPPQ